eukprot:scaffold369_cov177-Ochromonas_danica.AAC.9
MNNIVDGVVKEKENYYYKRGWDQPSTQKGGKGKSASSLPSSSSSPVATTKEANAAKKAKLVSERKGLICYDVCRGRERIDIPVINDIDDAKAPLDFVYVSQPVAGEGVNCTDNCRDPTRCECIRNSSGLNYDLDGRLVEDKPAGIYECNALCSCHVAKCKNRVVGRGPSERLEVFRCTNPSKGWGIRCRSDILPGTYIADYIGEILLEADAETRGLSICDEYLYTMDCWGRSQACLKLSQLGLKTTPKKTPRHLYTNAATTSEAELRKLLGEEFTDHLIAKGAVDRSIAMGREVRQSLLRSDPNPLPNMTNTTSQISGSTAGSVSLSQPAKAVDKRENSRRIMASWLDRHLKAREQFWSQASAVITDRSVVEVEEEGNQFIIDARWYGSVGRFLNHSCSPNLDIITVFCDTHDVRLPRVAFFANDFIPANTELCYDYGYLPGLVEGKHRPCLCGAPNCRKTWY